ncbi:MAG: hypothetical protein WC595_05260 [Candidatus Nanoarchaeia archaeon]
MKHLWFKAKRYGWGWNPANEKGWIVLATFVMSVMIAAWVIEKVTTEVNTFMWIYIPVILILSGILFLICYKTGEKPKWRWGK